MKVTDLVIEASQAVFEWSARHKTCVMPQVHTVPPNCEATVKARERDVPHSCCGLGRPRVQTFCTYFWGHDLVVFFFKKKRAQKHKCKPNVLCGSKTFL